jgi:O-antigen/teichoic acid export membrane protein
MDDRSQISPVVRDFLVLAGGTVIGQLVIFAVTPILTRLLSPADVGLFGTMSALVAIFTVISSLGFETAIIGAEDEDAVLLVGIAWNCTIVLVLCATGCLGVLQTLDVVHGLPNWFPWLVALNAVLAGFFVAAQYWYIREQRYNRASIGTLALNLGRGAGSVLFAAILPGSLALPCGDVCGRLVGIGVIDRAHVLPRAIAYVWRAPAVAWDVARRYWKSAAFLMPSTALEVTLFWLPVLLSSSVYGADLGGQVALAQRILAALLAIVGKNLSDVFQVQITGQGSENPVQAVRSTQRLIGATIALAVPLCIACILWGPLAFTVIFGPGWTSAGAITGILLPMAILQLSGNILTRLLIEVGRQELRLVAYLAWLVSMLASFYAGYQLQWSMFATLEITSISGCVILAVWICASFALCRFKHSE